MSSHLIDKNLIKRTIQTHKRWQFGSVELIENAALLWYLEKVAPAHLLGCPWWNTYNADLQGQKK
jgi:hypothetical protein